MFADAQVGVRNREIDTFSTTNVINTAAGPSLEGAREEKNEAGNTATSNDITKENMDQA